MAISRRLRFEILRRDDHACRYCGARAPDVPLTIDHVVPTTLGGSDDASNLVTACRDCNSGKSSVSPDAALVENVEAAALRWKVAMEAAAQQTRDRREALDLRLECFDCEWKGWTHGDEALHVDRPGDWRATVARFIELGLDSEFLHWAVERAMQKKGVRGQHGEFRYFCGICWGELAERQEIAKSLIAREDADAQEPDA